MPSEVEKPIINSPFCEPTQHWQIHPYEPPKLVKTRRPAVYFYNDKQGEDGGNTHELPIPLVETLRGKLAEWRPLALRGEGGASRITMDLLNYWRREGREIPLFFAQLEAAETIIFLNEARGDFLQGIDIPQDDPSAQQQKQGLLAFKRRCCKMATGSGKTTVMAMLAAWSILNKVNDRQNTKFSDAVLIVCPNVTIRERLAELDPQRDEASIYRSRDLVPPKMMKDLRQGKVLVTNWHVFEPQSGENERVVKTGKPITMRESIIIGKKNQYVRGKRYMTEMELRDQRIAGKLKIIHGSEKADKDTETQKSVVVESVKYIESDRALVERVLKPVFGGKKNILVFNDEAHHAYRLQDNAADNEGDIFGEKEEADRYYKQATVWVEGLDKINGRVNDRRRRGINQCIDFTATPYFLQRAADNTNKIFPWTVSNFGLEDAIESGLVKVPMLATRDSSGAEVPGYFNIWQWIRKQLSTAERGGKKSDPKPEAIMKYAHTPLAMLGGLWEEERRAWNKKGETRPPVYIIVCKTTKLAKVMYEWIAEDKPPAVDIPHAQMPTLVNRDGLSNTIRVDSKVKDEIESGNSKSDEGRWMRYILDTVGKTAWHKDSQNRNIYPEGFAELVEKMAQKDSTYRQFLEYPPGRDVHCIISVGMLTEGWDCNTVTHIIGLRPFMSQLLCEQVIGRGLRRASYEVDENDLMGEEVATVLGVPLTSFPVKKTENGGGRQEVEKHHIFAMPQREKYEITFPRVEGYYQSIKHRVSCNMQDISELEVDGTEIPAEVEVKAGLLDASGRPSLHGPGEEVTLSLDAFRQQFRAQKAMFEITERLVDHFMKEDCVVPANLLFGQIYRIVGDYLEKKVKVIGGAERCDVFTSVYYEKMINSMIVGIKPDTNADETPELPRYEANRELGSSGEVNFRTKRKPFNVKKSHVNAVVADTKSLEQKVAYALDKHCRVKAFVKNEDMDFSIPYIYDGRMHNYMPDFIVRMSNGVQLVLETKGFDKAKKEKLDAAKRWVKAVNADNKYGKWDYEMISAEKELEPCLQRVCPE